MTPFDAHSRAIRLWLWAVAILVFAIVVVGGATRLTESGLSIVEWKPVTGTLPPLSEADWQAEFQKYQTIPQYELMNRGMSLDEFKTIFWWEWGHRLLGRLVGAAFLLPFLWFLWRGAIKPGLRGGLVTIFILGALQGGVGWWMVASGLTEGIHVSHFRLAAHLTFACVIYVALVWTAERLVLRPTVELPGRFRAAASVLVILMLLQIYFGALVAGMRAGLIYTTWPLIDGTLLPARSQLFFAEPLWRNFFDNALTVQFEHRMLGYVLVLIVVLHAADIWRAAKNSPAFTSVLVFALAVIGQAVLGIITLVNESPLWLALLHQAGALVVLTISVVHLERITPRPQVQPSEWKVAT